MRQGKLVREKIPQIIRSKGLQPVTYVADAEEYAARLRDKLAEEVDEFIASDDDPEELADIRGAYVLAEHAGTSGSSWRGWGGKGVGARGFHRPYRLVREPPIAGVTSPCGRSRRLSGADDRSSAAAIPGTHAAEPGLLRKASHIPSRRDAAVPSRFVPDQPQAFRRRHRTPGA